LPPWFPAILVRASQLDFFHVCAGANIREDLLNRTPEDWDPMLNLNINAVFRTADAARRRIIGRGTGEIVVTNSIAGHTAVPAGAELHRTRFRPSSTLSAAGSVSTASA
jgi:ribitol 2-dehydrogenase